MGQMDEEPELVEAYRLVNGERDQMYGPGVFKNIAVGWEQILKAPVTAEQVALCMVWLKVMQQINKPKRDNLVDIAGYAEMASRQAE